MKFKRLIFVDRSSKVGASDLFSYQTITELRNHNVEAIRLEPLIHRFGAIIQRFRIARLIDYFVSPFLERSLSKLIQHDDLVIAKGFTRFSPDSKARMPLVILKTGASYAVHIEDDITAYDFLHSIYEPHIAKSKFTVVSTPQIFERLQIKYKYIQSAVFEEPINVERVRPCCSHNLNAVPRVLWTGRQTNLPRLEALNGVFKEVHEKIPFILRVVIGNTRPKLNLAIPWEWVPYNWEHESESGNGCQFAIAPLNQTPYDECKGSYKVKVYMAMGLPVLASPVGHTKSLFVHQSSGLYANSNDDWFNAMVRLLDNKALAQSYGDNARKRVENNYSHKSVIPLWITQLKQILNP